MTDADLRPLRRALIGEALEAALGAPASDRGRLSAAVAIASDLETHPGRPVLVPDQVEDPLWRAFAWAQLAGTVLGHPGDGRSSRASRGLVRAVRTLRAGPAPPLEGPEQPLASIAETLVRLGHAGLAEQVCALAPGDLRTREAMITALVELGRSARALRVALAASEGIPRDHALAQTSWALARAQRPRDALRAAERIGEAFLREELRLEALADLEDAAGEPYGTTQLRHVRGPFSLLHALAAAARGCARSADAEGVRTYADAALRVALSEAIPAADRERAVAWAAGLHGSLGLPAAALEAARMLPEGPAKVRATLAAFFQLAPADEHAPALGTVLGFARDSLEREAGATALVRAHVSRGNLREARRWLRRVNAPQLRAAACQEIAGGLLHLCRDASGALRALAEVPPADREPELMRSLVLELLRSGRADDAAAVLRTMGHSAAWTLAAVGRHAARQRQVEPLRAWARRHLDPSCRVHVLLAAAGGLNAWDHGEGAEPFQFGADDATRTNG